MWEKKDKILTNIENAPPLKGPKSSFPVLSTRVEGYPDQISHKGSKIALIDSTNERKEEDHENKG